MKITRRLKVACHRLKIDWSEWMRINLKFVKAKKDHQKDTCFFTELPLNDFSLDHFVPTSNGGEHTWENLIFVLPEINSMKGTLTPDRFVWLCQRVAQCCDAPAKKLKFINSLVRQELPENK